VDETTSSARPGPRIVGLGGSASPSSTTDGLLRQCLQLLETAGARTTLLPGEWLARLPIYQLDAPAGATAHELVETVRAADAVVIGTPGYHGGMSGLMKNALDHLEALRGDARPYLDGRPVGVIVTAAGWQACGTALVSVRSTIHALRGWPTPFGVSVNTAEPVDDLRVAGALQILADQLLSFRGGAR
jgi:FMN reductase